MNTVNNQRRRETDLCLQETLLSFMKEGRTPTVGGICEKAKINRSTFYRHYLDIYDLMEKTERQIQLELVRTIKESGLDPASPKISEEALIPMIRYIGAYHFFYRDYLKTHLGDSVEAGMQTVWEDYLKPVFLKRNVMDETHMRYYYQYFRSGILSMLGLWLENGCREAPEELAGMMIRVLVR